MYELLPEGSYPKTVYVSPADDFEQVKKTVEENGVTYPFCVKPDVGMKGLLFRKIDSEQQLEYYHGLMPADYVIQELVMLPLEVSVFYYRYPNEQKGVITGFIQKDLMEVTGDGRNTLLQLIQEHPKAKFREEEMRIKHADHLNKVLPKDERYFLSYAANLNRGARFTNLDHLIDEQLTSLFDEFSHRGQADKLRVK